MSSPINSLARLLLALILLACPAAQAREVDRTTGVREKIYEQMQEIQTLAESKRLDEAEALSREMLDLNLSDYERAQGWFLLAYIRYQQEDMEGALAAYLQVMTTEDIPVGMRLNVMRNLTQLNMVVEDYQSALKYVDLLLATDPEANAGNHILKAQILYQLERMDGAMVELETGIRLNAELGKPPRENWLLLKNAILYHRGDYKGMLQVVQQLVDLYPRDSYLLNMAAIYGELGDSKKQLSLLEPLYERGSLSNATHLQNLASLYMLNDIPFKAATLLAQEIGSDTLKADKRNLEMLAQAWQLAASPEEAVGPMGRAAKLADDGRTYVILARTYMSLLRWQEAEKSLLRAFEKGGLRNVGEAHLMLGMARLNQKNFRDARRSFAQAGQAATTERLARQWLQYLEREEAQSELAREVGL